MFIGVFFARMAKVNAEPHPYAFVVLNGSQASIRDINGETLFDLTISKNDSDISTYYAHMPEDWTFGVSERVFSYAEGQGKSFLFRVCKKSDLSRSPLVKGRIIVPIATTPLSTVETSIFLNPYDKFDKFAVLDEVSRLKRNPSHDFVRRVSSDAISLLLSSLERSKKECEVLDFSDFG
jgi:hypothetical protein